VIALDQREYPVAVNAAPLVAPVEGIESFVALRD